MGTFTFSFYWKKCSHFQVNRSFVCYDVLWTIQCIYWNHIAPAVWSTTYVICVHHISWYCRIHSQRYDIIWKYGDKARIATIIDSDFDRPLPNWNLNCQFQYVAICALLSLGDQKEPNCQKWVFTEFALRPD